MSSAYTYVDNYDTCERTCVELRIYSESLSPEQISQMLAISPTYTYSRERKKMDEHNSALPEHNAWILSSEPSVMSADSRRHIDWLLDQIIMKKETLSILQNIPALMVHVYCIWWSKHGDGGPTLWAHQMRCLGDLGLDLLFDISFYGKLEEGETI